MQNKITNEQCLLWTVSCWYMSKQSSLIACYNEASATAATQVDLNMRYLINSKLTELFAFPNEFPDRMEIAWLKINSHIESEYLD